MLPYGQMPVSNNPIPPMQPTSVMVPPTNSVGFGSGNFAPPPPPTNTVGFGSGNFAPPPMATAPPMTSAPPMTTVPMPMPQSPPASFRAPSPQRLAAEQMFDSIDRSGTGSISRAEFNAAMGPQVMVSTAVPPPTTMPMPAPMGPPQQFPTATLAPMMTTIPTTGPLPMQQPPTTMGYGSGAYSPPSPAPPMMASFNAMPTSPMQSVTIQASPRASMPFPQTTMPAMPTTPSPMSPSWQGGSITAGSSTSPFVASGGQVSDNKLFMDDNKNWFNIADIAKSMVAIEADERMFAEEILKLPGGAEVLKWLKGGKNGAGPNVLQQVTASLEKAKRDAHALAAQAKQQAAAAKQAAKDAEAAAEEEEQYEETHHGLTPMQVAKQKEYAAVRKEQEAGKLANRAQQAVVAYQSAEAEWTKVNQAAEQQASYAQQVTNQAQQARQQAYKLGFGDGSNVQDLLDKEKEAAAARARDAQKARDAAARAQQKAQAALARLAQLQNSQKPGGPMDQLMAAQKVVDKAEAAKARVQTANLKVDGLQSLIAKLQVELQQARQEVGRLQQEAQQEDAKAQAAIQQSMGIQNALGIHLQGEGTTDDHTYHMDPEHAQQAIQDAQKEAADAQKAAQAAAQKANMLGQAAQDAQNDVAQQAQKAQTVPNLDGLDQLAENARLQADNLKTTASSLRLVADTCAKHAREFQEKAGMMAQDAQRAKSEAQKERESAETAPYNHKMPQGQIDPLTGKMMPRAGDNAIADRKRAADLEAQAAKALADAKKREEDAKRMDALVQMMETTMEERRQLEATVANVRGTAQGKQAQVDAMVLKAENKNEDLSAGNQQGYGMQSGYGIQSPQSQQFVPPTSGYSGFM